MLKESTKEILVNENDEFTKELLPFVKVFK